jgi:small nuclear ribonucleoprotein D3
MNCLLDDVVRTGRDGSKTALDQVFIRGAQVRYYLVPDMLRHAPMFKNLLKQRDGAAAPGGPVKGTAFGTMSVPSQMMGGKGKGRR